MHHVVIVRLDYKGQCKLHRKERWPEERREVEEEEG